MIQTIMNKMNKIICIFNNFKLTNEQQDKTKQKVLKKVAKMNKIICLFKKLLFTMENVTAADSNQSNVSRVYI